MLGVLMARRTRLAAGASVPDRLIDAAEKLYGEHGVKAVSLRQISVAAGTGNNNAVQYHFGDAAGLIRAILAKRAPGVDIRRKQLLAKCAKAGPLTTRALVHALYIPAIDHVNERGERALARFILALCSTAEGAEHLADIERRMPACMQILELLRQLNGALPVRLLRERIRLAFLMFLNSVFNRLRPYADHDLDDELIENALDMASAAISAPTGDYVNALIKADECSRRS